MDGILAPWHWAIVIAVVLLVFGPKKLPELGSSLGKGIAGFRNGMRDVQDEVSAAVSTAEAVQPDVAQPATPTVPEPSAVETSMSQASVTPQENRPVE